MEHDEQAKVFKHLKNPVMLKVYPDLRWIHAIPNGAFMRNVKIAQKMKREGMTRGIWDIFLPALRLPFVGLYIEMKYGKNQLTPEQSEFGQYVKENGYATAVCWSADEAIDAVIDYLEGRFHAEVPEVTH